MSTPWAPPAVGPLGPVPPRAGEPQVPVGEDERRTEVDALRAVALLGIVVVNVAALRRGVGPTLAAGGGAVGGGVDALTVGLSALAEGRFYPLFSFLFGWGFAVQAARSQVRARSVVGPWVRRCAALLVLGLLHAVSLFSGDILVTYALVGVWLPLVRRLGPGWLAGLGTALLVLQALFTSALVGLTTWLLVEDGTLASPAEQRRDLADEAATFDHGSFLDVARHRADDLLIDIPLGLVSVAGTVAGMMLLGVAAARAGWVDPRRWPSWPRRASVPLWAGGLALSIPAAWLLGDTGLGTDDAGAAALSWLAYALLGPAVALTWALVVLRAHGVATLRRALDWGAPLGRMSLTAYLGQSLVLSLLFHGYGLGLGDDVGIGVAVALGVAVWAAQVVLARWWLRSFTAGPLEALTRAVAYLRWTPLRRGTPVPTLASPTGRG